jgi:hypothetical protein
MSEQFIYQSVFAPYFKDFLAMKENQVSDIGRIKWMLLEFDKFFVNSNIRDVFITKSMIDTWKCTRIHDKKKTLYDKVSMFRQFCLYLCHIGKECYIPKLPKKEYSDFTPYVFTRGQRTSLKLATSKGCIVIIYIVIFLHYLLYIESYMLQGLESGKPYPLGIGMLI